ncbi:MULTISPECIES: pyrroline-5-carboxylate reductase [Mogibacterium]|uniref:Pyrroline-5-carboxylate reductase n=1 Tax=Mogibacterium timidum ATCC 33093 TaxID=1401079 RepID=X8J6Q5_9FIRM|nr:MULTISPECIES: pyrroline-5-carboxylate reductase [Mogibacterium]EUC57983.1 pyrroline-5-carboxylate reductase [Mogibacterium timidum ATCC 33093]
MKIGFIGSGVMANAMIGGIIKSGLCQADDIIGAAPTECGRNRTKEQNGIEVTADNLEVIDKCDVVFLSVKPQHYAPVIAEIKEHVKADQLFISIGAGITLDYLKKAFDDKAVKIVRVMPNTPSQVGAGMSAACPNEYVTEDEAKLAVSILSAFGKTEVVQESLFDVVTGISGSGPAYVFLFIEALADAAVVGGMPRRQAYEFAAQTVYGSAKMVMETGKHPGELKDMVCSPSGTTIAAVRALEANNFRSAVLEGANAATERSAEMRG